MSRETNEYYDVYDEKERRARKAHLCSACGEAIRIGDLYWRIGTIFEREARSLRRCQRCQEIHVHLRGLGDDMWPDEWLNCGEEYEHHWARKTPEEIAALAFVSPEEMQRRRVAKRAEIMLR
jgi:hypothetical protein